MKFVVIGYGFVGKAIHSVLSDKHDVNINDPAYGRHGSITTHKKNNEHVDGFVICVPTPEQSNGRCDDSLVLDYITTISKYYPQAHILIKSTTSVETLKQVKHNKLITFSPEFLGSETSPDTTQQFRDCDFAIYGGQDGRWWHEVLVQLTHYKDVRFLDLMSAGFLKYTENSFLALKVSFFNELHALYNKIDGGNYDAMIEALALDKRIGMSHTQVPGPDGQYGWGGHCLPKDTSEFSEYAKQQGADLQLLALSRKLNFEDHRA